MTPGGPGGAAPGPGVADPQVPVAARWMPADDLPATVVAMPARDPVGGVPLQRAPAATGEPSGPAAPPMREITFPGASGPGPGTTQSGSTTAATASAPLQRLAVPGAGTQWARGTSGLPAAARPGTPAHHRASYALARPATPGAAAPTPAAPVVQRDIAHEPGTTAAGATTAGPVPAAASASLPAMTATPVVQRVDGSAPPAPEGPAGRSDRELDELARALFGRIQSRLRTEVIHEREARGLGFDSF